MKHYRSSIPVDAKERVLACYIRTKTRWKVECVIRRQVVGIRWFDDKGRLELETPVRNGHIHGTQYGLDYDHNPAGFIIFSEPYRNGLPHGVTRQWCPQNGRLIGKYTMRRGTGLDLWRAWDFERQTAFLSEVRHLKDGHWHGFEWWFNPDQKTLMQESHFWQNQQHGIRIEWNLEGRLRRGYPQYWVNSRKVSKRKYLLAQRQDPTLPSYREVDNTPRRRLPKEVAVAIRFDTRVSE